MSAMFIAAALLISGCKSSEMNLNNCKKNVRDIYSSGRYETELKQAVAEGEAEIEYTVQGKPAVVFDVDETALSNFSYLNSMDFGYIHDSWNSWILEAKAEPIIPVLVLYKRLQTKGVHTIFVTGRSAGQYSATYKNLIETGYTKFDTLIVKQKSDSGLTASIIKETERQRLTEAGYTIIACVGDQWSDMAGKFTGAKIKLPNYVYLID